jgi:hypothetical protein
MISPSSAPLPSTIPPGYPISALGSTWRPPVSEPLFQLQRSNPGKPFEFNMTPTTPIYLGQPALLDLKLFRSEGGAGPSTFNIVHEKPAHIILVSQDLTDFQHVHPTAVGPGYFQVPVVFNKNGPYKLFIQFTTPEEKGEQTLSKPFEIGRGQVAPKPLVPDSQLPKRVDGYDFRISDLPTRQRPMSMPKVEVTQNGVPVKNIEPFLGAGAHGVIIGENAKSFMHVHPMSEPKNGLYSSPIKFHTEIRQPGVYKMWVQTLIDGKVKTVNWTFQV